MAEARICDECGRVEDKDFVRWLRVTELIEMSCFPDVRLPADFCGADCAGKWLTRLAEAKNNPRIVLTDEMMERHAASDS